MKKNNIKHPAGSPSLQGFGFPTTPKSEDIFKLLISDEDFSACFQFHPHGSDSLFDLKTKATSTCLFCVIISVIKESLQNTDHLLVCFPADDC